MHLHIPLLYISLQSKFVDKLRLEIERLLSGNQFDSRLGDSTYRHFIIYPFDRLGVSILTFLRLLKGRGATSSLCIEGMKMIGNGPSG